MELAPSKSHEEQQRRRETARDVFRFHAGSNDRDLFDEAFIGNWATRSAFGEHLLSQYEADRHLQQLPSWLRNYVALDPLKFVADFESAGHYYVAEVEDQVYVFDGHVRDD